MVDKKSGALLLVESKCISLLAFLPSNIPILAPLSPPLATTKTESGETIAINQFATFIIGAGGFGGKTKSDFLKVCAYA